MIQNRQATQGRPFPIGIRKAKRLLETAKQPLAAMKKKLRPLVNSKFLSERNLHEANNCWYFCWH